MGSGVNTASLPDFVFLFPAGELWAGSFWHRRTLNQSKSAFLQTDQHHPRASPSGWTNAARSGNPPSPWRTKSHKLKSFLGIYLFSHTWRCHKNCSLQKKCDDSAFTLPVAPVTRPGPGTAAAVRRGRRTPEGQEAPNWPEWLQSEPIRDKRGAARQIGSQRIVRLCWPNREQACTFSHTQVYFPATLSGSTGTASHTLSKHAKRSDCFTLWASSLGRNPFHHRVTGLFLFLSCMIYRMCRRTHTWGNKGVFSRLLHVWSSPVDFSDKRQKMLKELICLWIVSDGNHSAFKTVNIFLKVWWGWWRVMSISPRLTRKL